MGTSALARPLRGIVTPLITPLLEPDAIDVESLGRLIDHVIAGGVSGVFVLGTTGEGPALSRQARHDVVEHACRIVAGRVPVMVGITDSSLADTLDLAAHSANCGAQAVVTAGPTYFPVAQEELRRWIRRMAAGSPLPVYLYNMPSHAHVEFSVDTVVDAAQQPNVAGLKDSSGNIMYLHALRWALKSRPDFALFVGPEEMMGECVMLGVHGGVNGGSNLFPDLYVSLYDAARAGDVPKVQALHAKVIEVSRRLYSQGSYGSSYLKGIKCAASQLGLCKNVLAPPYEEFFDEHAARIRKQLSYLAAEGFVTIKESS